MKPALSAEYVQPSSGYEKPNRPQAGLCLFLLSAVGGAFVLSEWPVRDFVPWIVGAVAIVSAGAGAVYHPINRFWMKGAVSGLVAGTCAMAVTYYCLEWGLGLPRGMRSVAIVLTSFTGALPGVGLYWLLMRHEVVDDSDVAPRN